MIEFLLVSVSIIIVSKAIKNIYAQGEDIVNYFSSED